MKAIDLAHRPAPSVPDDVTVQAAARAFRKFRSGALLVLRRGKLVGVLSERDLVLRVVGQGLDPRRTSVSKVMTSPVLRVLAGAEARAAFELMTAKHIRHLAVVDGRGKVVGMLSHRVVAEECIHRTTEQLRAIGPLLGIVD